MSTFFQYMRKPIFWIEFFAVVFNLLFTYLYLQSDPLCFLFGVFGPLLFVYLCYDKKLYAETALQVFYMAMAVYGYVNWGGEWRIEHRSIEWHLPYLIFGLAATFLMAYILKKKTDARLPLPDSFTTVFALIGTWIMMTYIHESWLYFIAINTISLIIYPMRGMWLSSIMFAIYLLMAIDGYFDSISIF
ncbi:MAG: nicotinamide riboside transporter PnuC [Flavobacteriales bacterium]|nr:nicotinamide riboside transporter PnuC [Flavobacteriales bacterium]